MSLREPHWITHAMACAAHTRLCVEHGLSDRHINGIRLSGALMRAPTLFIAAGRPVHAGELAAAYVTATLRLRPFKQANEATAYLLGMIFLELQGLLLQAKSAESYLMFRSAFLERSNPNAWSDWIALRLHVQSHPGKTAVAIHARNNQVTSYSILASRPSTQTAQSDSKDPHIGDLATLTVQQPPEANSPP